MKYLGKTKIGRFASKPGTIYPQMRLPQKCAHEIGATAHIYETEVNAKKAFLFVLEERDAGHSDQVLQSPDKNVKLGEEEAFEKLCKWQCVNVGSKEVIDGLFLVASVGMDCLHNRRFVATTITQLQERAESKKWDKNGFARPLLACFTATGCYFVTRLSRSTVDCADNESALKKWKIVKIIVVLRQIELAAKLFRCTILMITFDLI